MKVTLLECPTDKDWLEVKRRALKTVGLKPKTPPDAEWKRAILKARHSPIRYLRYSFEFEDLPYWISVHFVRHHVGVQPYVMSQRNDRQAKYDRNEAPQDAPVGMIIDFNAESLMEFANKRLCGQASEETREVTKAMCQLVEKFCPEFEGLLVPMCIRNGGVCHEMKPCGGHKND